MTAKYPGEIESPERFRELIERFEREEQRDYYYERALETVEREFDERWYESDELVLGGPMLLMYTFNFAAKRTKTMDKDTIQRIFERHHEPLECVRGTALIDADLQPGGTAYQTVHAVWDDMKNHFGQTGTAKVLSLLAPELFVMWDREIRTRPQRRRGDCPGEKRADRGVYFYLKSEYSVANNKSEFGRAAEDYIVFLRYCRDILEEIGDHPLFEKKDETPAKMLDEALYAFYKLENG